MTREQAQVIRKKLLYLEDLLAWETRAYIWKVVIAPAAREEMERFAAQLDFTKPFDQKKLMKNCLGEVSVYFFLKKNGEVTYMEYEEFLYLNNIMIPVAGHVPKETRQPG